MMMKVFTLPLLLWLLPALVWSQSVQVSGQITDAQTGEPVVGANVIVSGTTQGTITDQDGNYSLSVSSSDVSIKASYVGYQSQTQTSSGNENVTLHFALKPSAALEEVIIKSIRADQKAPVTQETVEREEIEKLYVGQDALYVLEQITPSILTYSQSGTKMTNYGEMRLRGIDQKRINITLNGVPLNDMIDQGVYFSNFTDFGNSIESVQVQRGVGTSTNGTASYAGSINFESINLQDAEPSAELQLSAGSFNTFRGSGEVKTGLINDKFSFYSRFSKTYSDGYRYHSGTDAYSFFFSGGYFGEKDLVKLTGFTGRTKNDLAYVPTALPDIKKDPRTNYISENDIDNFGQSLLQLQYTHLFTDNTSVASTLYYGSAGGDFPYGYVEDSTFTQINYPLYNDHYGFMSYLSHSALQNRLTIDGGIHLYTFRRKNIEYIIPNRIAPYYEDKAQKDEISAFGKVSYELGNLLLFGDLQVRSVWLGMTPDITYLRQAVEVPTRQWTFVNPKVGVTYQFNEYTDAYISYGRSGREPTRSDILGSTTINASNLEMVQNTNSIRPEYVNDLEAGVRINQEKLSAQANLFYMQFENEITAIGQSAQGFITLRENVAASYRRGIETSWSYQPIAYFGFSGDLTYMQSRIREYTPEGSDQTYVNVQPVISPNWLINASATYYGSGWQVSLSPRYVSQSYLELTNQSDLIMPSFFIVDAHANINLWQKHTLSLHVNNIFDEDYYTGGEPVTYDNQLVPGYFVQPPANFYMMLNIKF